MSVDPQAATDQSSRREDLGGRSGSIQPREGEGTRKFEALRDLDQRHSPEKVLEALSAVAAQLPELLAQQKAVGKGQSQTAHQEVTADLEAMSELVRRNGASLSGFSEALAVRMVAAAMADEQREILRSIGEKFAGSGIATAKATEGANAFLRVYSGAFISNGSEPALDQATAKLSPEIRASVDFEALRPAANRFSENERLCRALKIFGAPSGSFVGGSSPGLVLLAGMTRELEQSLGLSLTSEEGASLRGTMAQVAEVYEASVASAGSMLMAAKRDLLGLLRTQVSAMRLFDLSQETSEMRQAMLERSFAGAVKEAAKREEQRLNALGSLALLRMQVGPDGSVALQTREVQRLETFRVDGKEYQLAHVEPGKHKTLTDRIERLTALGVFWQGTEVGGLVLESPEGERFIQVKTPGEKDSYINVRLASDKVLAKPIEELTVISGPCLFSVQGVVAVLEDGSRVALTDPKSEITAAVEDLIIDERLSMYEAEASIRLGTFIAGYVGGSSLKSVSIHAQVPREEYYLYAIDAYNSGLMSQEIFSRWLDAVDARWATVRGALLGEVAHHNPSLSSEPETPLGRINSLIRSKVSANQAVLLPEAVAILREEDQLWKMILEVENPTSFRELNYLGYVHSVLRAGDARANEARVGISLENPVEERIMRRAEEIAKKLSKVYGFELRLVGIYPQQQIGVEGTDETHLYFAARAATDGQVAQLRQLYIGGNPEAV